MDPSPDGPRRFYDGIEWKIVKSYITKDRAADTVQRWWRGSLMARDLKDKSRITDCRLKYVPYWKIRARVDGYVDGEVDEGDEETILMRVKKTVKGIMTWTKIATDNADVGIYYLKRSGVETMPPDGSIGPILDVTIRQKEAFDMCHDDIENAVIRDTKIEKVIAKQVNVIPVETLIFFYPLWAVKYDYKGRTYPATVDGVTGSLLEGKAPGDPLLREIAFTVTLVICIAMALLLIWALAYYGSDACCPLAIIEFIGFAVAGIPYKYYRHGSEIRTGVVGDTYGPPDVKELQDHGLTCDSLKVDTISKYKVHQEDK